MTRIRLVHGARQALAKHIFTMAPPKKKKARKVKYDPLAPPKKKKAKQGKFASFLSALQEYHDGRQSVQEIVKLSRAYQGRNLHLLWDAPRGKKGSKKRLNKSYIDACFNLLTEEKMIELIRAMVAQDPEFCSKASPVDRQTKDRRTFLSVALDCARLKGKNHLDPNGGNTSFNVLRLLAVRGVTRITGGYYRCSPLLVASQISGLDPAVLHHLMDLDPEALLVEDATQYRPLHYALALWTAASDSAVSRMIELAPSSLVYHSWNGPVLHAMVSRGESPELSRRLRDLVEEHPLSAQPGVASSRGTALFVACNRCAHDRGLVEAVLRTYPAALCMAHREWHGGRLLPYEAAARCNGVDGATVRYLEQETVHMALAAVEYAIAAFNQKVDDMIVPAVTRDAAAKQHHSETDDDDDVDDDDEEYGDDDDDDDANDDAAGLDDGDAYDEESDSTYSDAGAPDVDASEEDWYEYDDDTADLVDSGAYDDMNPSVEFDSACVVAESHDVEVAEEDRCGNNDDDDDDEATDAYDDCYPCGGGRFDSAYSRAYSDVASAAEGHYKYNSANRFTHGAYKFYNGYGDDRYGCSDDDFDDMEAYNDGYRYDRYGYLDDNIVDRESDMDDDYYAESANEDVSDNDGDHLSEGTEARCEAVMRCPDDFRRLVLSIVSGAVRPADLPLLRRASGFAWTQALLKIDNCLEVCRELFNCRVIEFKLGDKAFREAVLGDAVLNLYRMNQMGGRSDPSPHHQVRLLALVSDNLESVYLQFREFGASYLVVGSATTNPTCLAFDAMQDEVALSEK
jgi:hypothetical protein